MAYMYYQLINTDIVTSSGYCAVVKIITKLINIVASVLRAHGVWYPSGARSLSLSFSLSLCTPHVISHGSQTVI